MSPNNWPWLELEQVAQVTAGNPAPQGDEYFLEGKRPFVRVQDLGRLNGASHLRETVDLVNDKASATLRLFPKGSVLFTKSGASLLLNQRAILGADMHVVSHIGVAVPGPRISSEWLYYWLRTVDFADISHGANMPSLPLSRVKKISIPVPSLDEQRVRIAEIEKQFSRLDEAVANLQRVKANLKRYKAAVLKAAVEGRLVETEAALARREGRSYETGEQLLQRILEERRSMWAGRGSFDAAPPSVSLEVVPEGWVLASIDQLATVVRGGSPRPAGDPRYFGGTVPWITVGSITADESDYLRHATGGLTEEGKERSRFIKEHTLLLTNSGATLGVPKISLVAGCINDGVAALLDVDYPLKHYLVHFLRTRTDALRQVNQGAAQPNLNTTIIKAMVVPLPPVAEQARIIAEVDRCLSIVREVEAEVDANLQRAKSLRQVTLSKAFEVN